MLTVQLSTLQDSHPTQSKRLNPHNDPSGPDHPPNLSSVLLPFAHFAPGAMSSSFLQPGRPSPSPGLLHVLWFFAQGDIKHILHQVQSLTSQKHLLH